MAGIDAHPAERRLRVSAQIQPHHVDYATMRQAWRDAEALGVDAIFTWDHFFPPGGDFSGKHFECLATLASMAEVTERAHIGALVVCNSFRNPDLIADAHRTIDHASGGRAILGIGAGWFSFDYEEYGYTFGTAARRAQALATALPRIKRRLTHLDPPPLGRLPLLIGAGGERVMLRLVAEHADLWHCAGPIETFVHKDIVLREHCRAVGRPSSAIERMWDIEPRQAETDTEALVDAGVEHLVMGVGGNGKYDLGPLRELLAWRNARTALPAQPQERQQGFRPKR